MISRNNNPFISNILILSVLCIVFSASSILFNFPYRPFPSDEIWGYYAALEVPDWWHSESAMLMNSPVHPAALSILKHFVQMLNIDLFQTFLFMSAISLGGAALMLGLTANLLTRNLYYSVAAAVLLLSSSWSQSYLHFYTYAPLASFFMTASLFCFINYFTASSHQRLSLAAAGFFTGLFFLSGSAVKLLAGLLLFAYAVLIFRSSVKDKSASLLLLLSLAALPVILLLPLYLHPLIEHLTVNVSAGNASDFQKRYGFAPKTPFFSFFYLLWVFSPIMLVFLMVSLAIAFFYWRRLAANKTGILVLSMVAILIIHCLILDLLPFTKLGRGQFLLLPIVILLVTLLYSDFPKGKTLGNAIFILFMLPSIILDTSTYAQTRSVRRDGPAEIEKLPMDTVYFVLDEDPHGKYLYTWLEYGGRMIYNITSADLRTSMQMIPRSTPIALLLGPMGPNSGRSILEHGMMAEFSYTLPPEIAMTTRHETVKLPFYAHYPLFLMEEENCQYLYFTGQVPKESSGQDRLTVTYWPPE